MNGQEGSLIGSILPLVVLFGIFYFLIIRPQQKQAKEHKEMVEGLKKGDKVVTNGGFIVAVTKVEEDFFQVQLADKTIAKLSKDFVAKKLNDEQNS
jgi:preprotein translocase subunit YajC